MLDLNLATETIDVARSQGFALAGFTDLDLDETDRFNLSTFVEEGRSGEMEWFDRYHSLRLDPASLLVDRREDSSGAQAPHARSAMVLGMVYVDREYEAWLAHASFRIARYAVGRDYHRILKKRSLPIVSFLKQRIPHLVSRVCVDSVPLPEKILARKAGLGWQGKHTNLIHPSFGSWFVLCVILLSCGLEERCADAFAAPPPDLCRDCALCVKACPTGALEEYRIDPRRCLSYVTIESREDRTAQANRRKGWVFGCDICQEVCPFNRSSSSRKVARTDPDFAPMSVVPRLLEGFPDQDVWKQTEGMALRRIGLDEFRINYEMASVTEC